MPAPLISTPVTDEERQKNDTHPSRVVMAVLALFFVYIYLFTNIWETCNIISPEELAINLGLYSEYVFDSDGNIEALVSVTWTQRFEKSDVERLILFLIILGAFLSSYYIPLKYKQATLMLWSIVGISILYGLAGSASFLFALLAVYLSLQPHPNGHPLACILCGLYAYLFFLIPLQEVFISINFPLFNEI